MPTSSTRSEYQRERRRVLQAVRRAEKRGIIVDRSLIPELKKHPTKRDINVLKTIKPSTLLRSLPISEQKVVTDSANIVRNNTKNISTTNKVKKPVQDINTNRIKTGGTNKTNVGTTKLSKVKAPKSPKVKAPKLPKVKVPKQKKEVTPKLPLTAEQKHDIRVKAGKKAWETKRGKMSDEEYNEFRKKFAEQMKQAKDIKRKIEQDLAGGEFTFEMPPENVIDLGILDLIERAINDIPIPKYVRSRGRFFTGYFWNEDYPLLSVFYDYINEVGEENASEYYHSIEQELMESLVLAFHDSEQDYLETHLGKAMILLGGGRALSMEESIALNDYQESLPFNIGDYNV